MILYTRKLQVGGLFPSISHSLNKKFSDLNDLTLYKSVLDNIAKDYNSSVEDLQKIMAATSYHESRNRNVMQDGGGPGRGYYQFELKSTPVAANRLKDYLVSRNIPVPEWVHTVRSAKEFDARILTPTQQNLLFLGEHRQKPTSPFNDYLQGKVSGPEWWAQGHNAKKDKANKAGFERDSIEAVNKPLPSFIATK